MLFNEKELCDIVEKSLRKVLNETTPEASTHKTILNVDELAAYTGLSKSYLYRLTSTGGIPFYKPQGKQLYFQKQEIDAWLLRNRKSTNAELDSKAATFLTTKGNAKWNQ